MSNMPALQEPEYGEEEEVWFTNPHALTLHGHVRRVVPFYLADSDESDSQHMYVVRDDSGVDHFVEEQFIERPAARAVIEAERHIRRTIETLLAHSGEGRWVERCVRDLEDSLYELSKPND